MEAFSLLKYWKSAGTGGAAARVGVRGGGGAASSPVTSARNGNTTTIVAAGDFDSDVDAGDDDGPFFDLEFAVPEEEDEEEALKLERENGEIGEIVAEYDHDDYDDDGRDRELKLRPSSSTSSYENDHCDSNVVSLSPSDEVLFKGQIVRIEGEEVEDEGEVNSKSGQIPIPASLLRSATKFQVFMLKLKRSKSDSITTTSTTTKSQPQKQSQQHRNNKKFFTVKFKVDEVPVISLLSRASSNSKSNTTTSSSSTATTAGADEHPAGSSSDSGDEKRNKKEVIQKYLKLVKPLYIRVPRRNQLPLPAAEGKEEVVAAAAEKSEMKGQKALVGLNLKGMMMAKKHLGKSKSAVVHSNSSIQNVVSNRRDDSLLQQQDGIQGAILHCKRSFNNASSTRDLEEKEGKAAKAEAEAKTEAALALTRSASDPSHQKKRTTETELTREKEDKNDVVVPA
ncbi:hypothetical protein Cgig2_031542 [Carnegiea gigantea]|uniref:Membrane-associated kinase regulator 2 n=1 Tax=Carnegiea gigantea TaxID=171969 RepID=A0A9Q1K3J7_9CARY|nr:hypothetical protein Cgig2_031542 [Carnegiea gigantea]